MATPNRDWRELITPERLARIEKFEARLGKRAVALPVDLTPAEMGEYSIARSMDPMARIEDVLGTRPTQGRLALHMTGEGVKGHGVSSTRFATFLARMDETLAATAKKFADSSRRTSRFVFAAVEPGSLAFELQAPDVTAPKRQGTVVDATSSSVESDALRAVTTVLTESTRGGDDELESAIVALPDNARLKLFKALDEVAKSRWVLDGSLRQQDFAPVGVEVPLEATARLRYALQEKAESTEHKPIVAEISGFRREEGLVWLAPMNGDDRFPASAANHRVMRAAREAGAVDGVIVRAEVTIEKRVPKTESASLKISRVITDLEVIATPRQLPFEQGGS